MAATARNSKGFHQNDQPRLAEVVERLDMG